MKIQMAGVSTALKAEQIDGQHSREWVRGLIRNVVEQLEPELRRHIGDVTPQGPPQVNVSGPHSDPLQGHIYVVSLAVPVDVDALPADCSARVALVREERSQG